MTFWVIPPSEWQTGIQTSGDEYITQLKVETQQKPLFAVLWREEDTGSHWQEYGVTYLLTYHCDQQLGTVQMVFTPWLKLLLYYTGWNSQRCWYTDISKFTDIVDLWYLYWSFTKNNFCELSHIQSKYCQLLNKQATEVQNWKNKPSRSDLSAEFLSCSRVSNISFSLWARSSAACCRNFSWISCSLLRLSISSFWAAFVSSSRLSSSRIFLQAHQQQKQHQHLHYLSPQSMQWWPIGDTNKEIRQDRKHKNSNKYNLK